jgi:hypothetical protein
MDTRMTPEDFYHDFLLIREMRAPTSKRYRMLGELFAVNPDAWRVIGVTEAAVKVFAKHDFKRVSRMGINRSHLVDRIKTYTTMLEGPLMECDEWWNFYVDTDKTILSTSTENMSKGELSKVYNIDPALELFKSHGFAWRHKDPEIQFLKETLDKFVPVCYISV